jgi:hypothetical protein
VGAGGWQPIESAPEDRDILLFCPEGVCTKVFVGYWDVDCWSTPEGGEIVRISGHPTHWMPLPEPPEGI